MMKKTNKCLKILVCSFVFLLSINAVISNETIEMNSISVSQNKKNNTKKTISKSKTVLKVYVENSGSMYGYVNGGSDFRNVVYNYLQDIKLSSIVDSMHLYFINSETINQGTVIEDFADKLQPDIFKISGGNGAISDISDMLKRIYPTRDNELVMFVSDCIFSPGPGKDANNYLVNQQIGIKGNIASYIQKTSSPALLVYRMLGNFKGKYYDKNDKPTFYQGIRPYYILMIGNKQEISAIRQKTEKKFKTKPDKVLMLSSENKKIGYAVSPGGGNYQVSKTNPHEIRKLKLDKKQKKVVIKLMVNLSTVFQSDSYILNPNNYTLNYKQFKIEKIEKCNLKNNFTHIFTITSKSVKKGNLKIELKNNLPKWVKECNDDDGGCVSAADNPQLTFGLKYMLGGMYDAFTYNSDKLGVIEISIN